MVLPISGFLPVPLPMMIPFMGAQSLVIGKMFGEGFQYGKRKISAMPNEEFNKLTFETMMSNAREEIKASIPTMALAMQDMKPLVDVIIREFLQYINEISKTLQDLTVTGVDQAAHLVGTHVGHSPATPVTEPTVTPVFTEEGTLAPPPVTFPKPAPTPETIDKTTRELIKFLQIDMDTFHLIDTSLKLNYTEAKALLASYTNALHTAAASQFQKQQVMLAMASLNKAIYIMWEK